MKCHIMWHFIWVCNVCQSTLLGVSGSQRVNLIFSNWLVVIATLSSHLLFDRNNYCGHSKEMTNVTVLFRQQMHMF